MKKITKKGFTIVELVIVIAVIGILAAVLIPTFSGIIEDANTSAALQEARSMYSEYVAQLDYEDDAELETTVYVEVKGYFVKIEDGKPEIVEDEPDGIPKLTKGEDGKYITSDVEADDDAG